MNPWVEDHLLREAVVLEVNGADQAATIAGAWERLAAAVRHGEPLASVLGGEARRAAQDDIDAILAARGTEESFVFSRLPSPVEDQDELATLLDALLQVEAIGCAEAEAFLLRRGQAARRRAQSGEQEDRAVGPLDGQLDDLLAPLVPAQGWELFHTLNQLGVLGDETHEPAARLFMTAERAEPERIDVCDIGAALETLPGPPDRYCGVRVLAVELCEDGVLVHVHRAINPADESGFNEPLADEVAVDTPAWPLTPPLRLHDSAGTAYRGAVEAAGDHYPREVSQEGTKSLEAVAFMPAVPPGPGRLWLEADDGRLRIDLR